MSASYSRPLSFSYRRPTFLSGSSLPRVQRKVIYRKSVVRKHAHLSMNEQNLAALAPFFLLLLVAWTVVAGTLWAFEIAEASLYYLFLYATFLGVIELSTGFAVRLPKRRWLNAAIAVGFVGWAVGLLRYVIS